MDKKSIKNFLVLAILVPVTAFGNLSEQMRKPLLRDIDVIRATFAVKYAPKEWKAQYKNWHLNQEIKKAKSEVNLMNPLTIKGYQRVLKKFFQSTADYHVGVEFYSTEFASLPFTVKGANGRYFIVEIDRNIFPLQIFPAEIGDEIISFGDRPIADVVNELKASDYSQGIAQTDQALAEIGLTMRTGSQGMIIPKGQVNLVTKSKNGEKKNFAVYWLYVPERVTEFGKNQTNKIMAVKEINEEKDPIKRFLNRSMIYAYYDPYQLPLTQESSYQIGAKKSYLPLLGTPIWQNDPNSNFDSYIFMQSGKRIGYVRIASYNGADAEVDEFRALVKRMEASTDLLVVDQFSNPGGSLFYVYALASLLTPYPLVTPRHNIALTQEEVLAASSYKLALSDVKDTPSAQAVLGKTFGGYPVTYEFAQKTLEYADLILSEWATGNQITKPTFMIGVDVIQPSVDGRYSKPILLLINSLDFSGGDFFPAIMKDNYRVTLLGTRTAGAGGVVTSNTFYNLGGIKAFRVTGTIARTKNTQPLENNGVIPHITVELTENDLQNNCIDMKQAILRTVDALIRG